MKIFIAVLHKILNVCKLVPMLPIVIVSALPIALLWDFRPWNKPFWFVDPSIGQWIVIVLVAYTVIDTLRGMIDDIRHGHVGVDILAVVALLSTMAVGEYWASWVVVLMVFSGSAIEAYAEDKAKNNLTALMEAAPQIAHVADLPGVGSGAHAASPTPRNRMRGRRGMPVRISPTPRTAPCPWTRCGWAMCSSCCPVRPYPSTANCSVARPRWT